MDAAIIASINIWILLGLWSVCNGAFISPNGYTLRGVMISVNGSDLNGGCPTDCVGGVSGIKRCDCGNTRNITETGFLVDGIVPTVDAEQSRGTWASQLYTISGSMTTYRIGFTFQNSVALREVELYTFFCPDWDIGTATITISTSVSFPNFIELENVGSVTLTSAMQDCVSLTRINIPIQVTMGDISNYFIEFTDPIPFQGVYIGEVRFSDEPIPTTTANPTNPVTDRPTTDGGELSSTSNFIQPSSVYLVGSVDMTSSVDQNPFTTGLPSMVTTTQTVTPQKTQTNPELSQVSTTNTTITTDTTTNSMVTTNSMITITTIIILSVIVVFLLTVVITGSVIFIIKKTKSSDGVVANDVNNEGIETKRNEAYGPVRGGREGGVELVRNEAYITASEIMVSDENEYEEIIL